MKRIAVFLLFCSTVLFAQTAETAFFRVVMLPSLEVPALGGNNRGTTDVFASVVRDGSGQIVSGTVDILTRTTFTAATNVTGLDIRSGATGQNGEVAIAGGLGAGNTRPIQTGADVVHVTSQIAADNAAGVSALRSLFQDPSKFYLNLLTTELPNGAVRGQLQRATSTVLMGLMTSANNVPAPTAFAKGTAQVVAIGTQDANGNWTSGEVYLSGTYFSLDLTAITGFHIHPGAAGATGAIVITGTLPAGLAPNPSGSVNLGPVYTEVTVTNAAQLSAFTNLFNSPGSVYIDVHTAANPNGAARAQLRGTDSMAFPVVLDSANEVKKPSVQATAPSTFTVYTLRNEDSSVAAATVQSDISYRFPNAQQFLATFLHAGQPNQDGPETLRFTGDFHADIGFGNYFNWSLPVADPATMGEVIKNPENYYLNLNTIADPAGAVRAQLAAEVSQPATVAAVISADLDKSATTVAPGALISLFGVRLAKVADDLRGWAGQTLPPSLNGASVTIAGKHAPLLYVSPTQINAQVPFDTPSGVQMVVVDNGNGPGPALAVNVAPVAPGIFFSPVAAILRNVNFSLVTATNPAKVGEAILIYATGLGQTNPPLTTGGLVPGATIARTAPVTVKMGGRDATVIYSIAAPQFAGLYQVAVTVPSGVSGSVPLTIQQGTTISNSVNVSVQ